ncbi:hypothetical protein KP509_05G094600 [Ceratopteris richardii]|uniref:Cytochrome P450 n=1 Tax=Ceratopteris richardii TaxID=49495 RepID=A0A8T2UW02_CERRI|nr:hypothetical protein KP509_05G094600 [Ceratopteris richardii]
MLLMLAIAFLSIAAVCSRLGSLGWIVKDLSLHIRGEPRTGGMTTFPPGPRAWPIIGHLHLLASLPHQIISDLSGKYGPVVGLRLGQRRAIAVCTPATAREVLFTHDKIFANRPPFQVNEEFLYGRDTSIVFTSLCPAWKRNRKICTIALATARRTQQLEYILSTEVSFLLREIYEESQGGRKAVEVGRYLQLMTGRLTMRLIDSEARFVPRVQDILELIKEIEQEVSSPFIGDFIPALSFLDVWKRNRVRRMHQRMDSILSALIVRRKQVMINSSSSFDDLLEVLISNEANQNGCAASTAAEDALTVGEMKAILLEIFGGVITPALTIEWALAELLKHPQCLQRLRMEIKEALPKKGDELIREEDIANVDFLKCVLKEVARLHPTVPMLVPRISTQECHIGGYMVPPQTLAFVNVWGIGRDESVWPNALQFLPERFEGKDVDLKGQHFELLLFGSGRRICMGLPLAVSMVSVTLANLIHHFDWQLPDGQTPETLNMGEKNGLNLSKAEPTTAVPKARSMTATASAPV